MEIALAILGIIVGGLLNRLAEGFMAGRFYRKIRCPYCDTPYRRWLALEKALRGQIRCNSCGAPYLVRPLFVELATGLIFALLWRHYGLSLYLTFALLYACALIVIIVTDLEKRLVPDKVIYPSIALALVGEMVPSCRNWVSHLIGGGIALGLFVLFYLAGGLIVRLRGKSPAEIVAFGLGDVKLATFIGLVLGFPQGLRALVIGVLINGTVALSIALKDLLRGQYNPFKAFPYGPALILSAFVFWLS